MKKTIRNTVFVVSIACAAVSLALFTAGCMGDGSVIRAMRNMGIIQYNVPSTYRYYDDYDDYYDDYYDDDYLEDFFKQFGIDSGSGYDYYDDYEPYKGGIY